MNRLSRASIAALALLALPPRASAQLETVPMKGLGNDWVKKLELRGRSEWEWLETYPEQVYFATRVDSERNGDAVTMWLRIEYKNPQSPGAHKSAASRDDWDCRKRQRSTRGLIFYKWNNLQDEDPERSTNLLRYWEKIEPGTIGETLLNFACSIKDLPTLITPPDNP
ncbi:MAG: surface-adhesin E family protein [Steroidobacteraceae bacterium]